MDIYEYLSSRNIIVNDEKFKDIAEVKNIYAQIQLIADAHSKLLEGRESIIPRIDSTIGREIENYKVDIKKNKKFINKIENNKNISENEWYLINEGKKIVRKAEETLNLLDLDMYYKIIKRSMKRYEICLGRVDENSLRVDKNEIIYLKTTKYISYNLVESDCYSYIKKLKRRKKECNIDLVIKDFVNKSQLDEDSIRYLKILSIYPNESMKLLDRYRNEKLDIKDENIIKKINYAEEIDDIKEE